MQHDRSQNRQTTEAQPITSRAADTSWSPGLGNTELLDHLGLHPSGERAEARRAFDEGAEALGAGAFSAGLSASGGLPAELRATLEQALGADLSTVRVSVDSAVGQAGALAWADGEHLHFAPGAWNPESQKGRELIGHEVVHVLQQRGGQGRQGDQGGMNRDPRLERDADVLGRQAAQGRSVRVPGAGSGVAASGGAVQCAFGVEMELNQTYVTRPGGELPAKRDVVARHDPVDEELLTLQAENANDRRNTEFVSKEGGLEPHELVPAMGQFSTIASLMLGRRGDYPGPTIGGDDDLQFRNISDQDLSGSIQVTLGVPLARVADMWANDDAFHITNTAVPERVGDDSPELHGFICLVDHVLRRLRLPDEAVEPFPKGRLDVLPRTSFGTMFALLPEFMEADGDVDAIQELRELVLARVGRAADERAIGGQWKLPDAGPDVQTYSYDLTIGEWMMGWPDRDRLSDAEATWADGTPCDKTTNIGTREATDDLGHLGRGVILELRRLNDLPGGNGTGIIGQWIERVRDMHVAYDGLLGRASGAEVGGLNELIEELTPEVEPDGCCTCTIL